MDQILGQKKDRMKDRMKTSACKRWRSLDGNSHDEA